MADFLVQRYLHNLTNEIRKESGVWEDCFVVENVTAAQAKDAVEQAMSNIPAARPGVDDKLRALRWDTMSEFSAPFGPRVLSSSIPTSPPVLGGTAGTA